MGIGSMFMGLLASIGGLLLWPFKAALSWGLYLAAPVWRIALWILTALWVIVCALYLWIPAWVRAPVEAATLAISEWAWPLIKDLDQTLLQCFRENIYNNLDLVTTVGLVGLVAGWLVGHVAFQYLVLGVPRFSLLHRKRDASTSWDTATSRPIIGGWLLQHKEAQPKFLTHQDFNRVAWINDVIEAMWPSIRASVDNMVSDVRKYINSFFFFFPIFNLDIEVDLGSRPLKLGGIKSYASVEDQAAFEAHLMWGSDMAVRLGFKLGFLGYYLTLPLFTISNLIINGPIRISLDGLQPALLFFGTLSLAFPETPDIKFDVSTLLPYDLTAFPGVDTAVHFVFSRLVMAIMGFPRTLGIPIDQGTVGEPDGILHIRKVRVEDLRPGKTLSISKVDPYVRFLTTRVLDGDGEGRPLQPLTQRKTVTAWNKSSHQFEGDFFLPVLSAQHHQLTLVVMHDLRIDVELLRAHFSLAAGSEILTKSMAGEYLQVRVPQKTKHGSGGTLQCEVRYEPFPHTTEYKRMMLARRYAENPEEQKGILGVKVDRCFNLINPKASAMVRLTVLDKDSKKKLMQEETKVDPATRNPVFNESFDFCEVHGACKLLVEVVDTSRKLLSVRTIVRKPNSLGRLKINVSDVVDADRIVENFMLQEVATGQIKMTLTWNTIWPKKG